MQRRSDKYALMTLRKIAEPGRCCSELLWFWTVCHFVFFKNYFTGVGKARRIDTERVAETAPANKKTWKNVSKQLVPLLESNRSRNAFASSRM